MPPWSAEKKRAGEGAGAGELQTEKEGERRENKRERERERERESRREIIGDGRGLHPGESRRAKHYLYTFRPPGLLLSLAAC